VIEPPNLEFGYCEVVTGDSCAPHIAPYNNSVFYYMPITATRDEQKAEIATALGVLASAIGIASYECQAVLGRFACMNLYAPCLTFPDKNLTIRRPTCQSVCVSVRQICNAFLTNPLVLRELVKYPDINTFLYCNATDSHIENRESFPETGYDIYGQWVPCNPYLPGDEPPSPTYPPSATPQDPNAPPQDPSSPQDPRPAPLPSGQTTATPQKPTTTGPNPKAIRLAANRSEVGGVIAALIAFIAAVFAL
jgi:hypothetical protein